MVSYGDVSPEEFAKLFRAQADDINRRIGESNKPLEEKLPGLWGSKADTGKRSMFDDKESLQEARQEIFASMRQQEQMDTFLDDVTALTGVKTGIREGRSGHRDDQRDLLFDLYDPETGGQLSDPDDKEKPLNLRVLLDEGEGMGSYNEAVQTLNFYTKLGLKAYRVRSHVEKN